MEKRLLELYGEFQLASFAAHYTASDAAVYASGGEPKHASGFLPVQETHESGSAAAYAAGLWISQRLLPVEPVASDAVILGTAEAAGSLLGIPNVEIYRDANARWIALRRCAIQLSKTFNNQLSNAQLLCPVKTFQGQIYNAQRLSPVKWAQNSWEFVLRHAKAIDLRIRHRIQDVSTPASISWKGRFDDADRSDILPAVQAYFAYRLSLILRPNLFHEISPRAQVLLRQLPANAPLYLEDREELIQATALLIIPILRTRRLLVATYAVSESVCGYFLRRLDFPI